MSKNFLLKQKLRVYIVDYTFISHFPISNCRRELLFPSINVFRRDFEIASTETKRKRNLISHYINKNLVLSQVFFYLNTKILKICKLSILVLEILSQAFFG